MKAVSRMGWFWERWCDGLVWMIVMEGISISCWLMCWVGDDVSILA